MAGWVPVLASTNLRHAFAAMSDEVDASLVFVFRYGLNLREFLFSYYYYGRLFQESEFTVATRIRGGRRAGHGKPRRRA